MHQLVPIAVFGEYLKHFVLFAHVFQTHRVTTARDAQQHIVVVRNKVKDIDIAGRWHQCTGIVINVVAHPIVSAIGVAQRLEQRGFTLTMLFEKADDIFRSFFFHLYGTVFLDNLEHTFLDACNLFRGQFHLFTVVTANGAEITQRNRVLYAQIELWEQFPDCASQNHGQRAHIRPHTGRAGNIQKLNVLGFIHQEIQVLQLVIDTGCHHAVTQLRLNHFVKLHQRRSALNVVISTSVFAINGYFLHILSFFYSKLTRKDTQNK